jgi:hypothetical protein
MISMLGHQVNKPVLVSMPAIFRDGELLACTLIGIETSGLWLESSDLVNTLRADSAAESPKKIFVPFTQIAFLMEGPVAPPSGGTGAAPPSTPRPARGSPTRAATRKRK